MIEASIDSIYTTMHKDYGKVQSNVHLGSFWNQHIEMPSKKGPFKKSTKYLPFHST